MGEYINHKGEQIKLGTCEDLYYTRLEQLKDLAGINPQVKDYLNPEHGFRYRFPFPEEDNILIGDYQDYNKGIIISLQHEDNSLVSDMEHLDMWHACHPKTGSHNINVATPCPQSKEIEHYKHSPINSNIVAINQLKQVDGEIWTVISCPYCEAKVRLPIDDAFKLTNSIIKGYLNFANTDSSKTYYQAICDRILNGYKILVS